MYSPETPKTTYPQYTNLALGEGLFDQLMAAVDKHLDKQYKDNRLRGTQYAEVYVGSIQGVMQNTTQYLLGQLLIEEKATQMAADTSLTIKQEQKIDAEIKLMALEEEKLRFEIDVLYPLQKIKVEAEIALINAQILKITAEIAMLEAQQVLMLKQALKIDKEIEYLTAKIRTEQANTIASIADSGSLIGKQIALLGAQKLGFAGDLHVKAAKVYADYDAVFQSVQEDPNSATLRSGALGALGSATTTANAIGGVTP